MGTEALQGFLKFRRASRDSDEFQRGSLQLKLATEGERG